ncbi:MAG: hypothetical protein HRU17_04550 [Polyangiaceae bacterium]|nr:hypothetical protein [Polyangiaceae bacterium]
MSGAPHRLFLLGFGFLYLAIMAYFVPPAVVFSDEPIITFDYSLHAYQMARALEAFNGWGTLHSYDPFVLAGQPAGTLEDLTSKSAELFVIALARFQVPATTAYNVYVALVHLLMPVSMYWAAYRFGLSQPRRCIVVVVSAVLWFFDSLLHWFWYVGMISWAAASYLCVLFIALLFDACRRPSARRFALTGVTGGLLALVHPFSVFAILGPALVTVWTYRKRLGLASRVHLALAGCLSASTCLVWLSPALEFRHYMSEIVAFLKPGPQQLILDAFDIMPDVLMTGEPVRTAWRWLTYVFAGYQIVRWRQDRNPLAAIFSVWALVGVAIAYCGALIPAMQSTQPYRQLGPLLLALSLPAAVFLEQLSKTTTWRSGQQTSVIAICLVGVVVAPRLLRSSLLFVPNLLPPGHTPTSTISFEPTLLYRGHSSPPESYRAIRSFLLKQSPYGRVAITDWVLSEYLAATTHLATLGGIPQRFVPHVDAHPLRQNLGATTTGGSRFDRYLESYAVQYVVHHGPQPLQLRSKLIELVFEHGDHRVYRALQTPDYFASGSGLLASQGLNLLKFRQMSTPTKPVVLRFHWLENLRCRPGCRVERANTPGDRAGFIRVIGAPPDFEIFYQY